MQPWQEAPFKTAPDEIDVILYAAVGRFITIWEHTEFALARLHAKFRGASDHDMTALREYGTGTTFRNRIAFLERSAERFFIRCCSQTKEAEFEFLLSRIRLLSDRRNEIAHGSVFSLQFWPELYHLITGAPESAAMGFVLVPNYHLKRHHIGDIPHYAYACADIERVSDVLRAHVRALHQFREGPF